MYILCNFLAILADFTTQITVFKMLRRPPTRIELKLDDLEEYESMIREREQKKHDPSADSSISIMRTPGNQDAQKGKTKTDMVHARIGYEPAPVTPPRTHCN